MHRLVGIFVIKKKQLQAIPVEIEQCNHNLALIILRVANPKNGAPAKFRTDESFRGLHPIQNQATSCLITQDRYRETYKANKN